MSKYRNTLVVVLIILVIVLAAVAVYLGLQRGSTSQPQYSAVYLSSGEIYVGKLSYFPSLTLTDVYLIQFVKEQPATDIEAAKPGGFQLAPLSDTVWAPQKLYLNSKQVVFTAPMRDDSRVVQGLKSKTK